MTSINQLFSEETIHALAWTVVHSLWQGVLIALIFSLCYSNMKNKTAKFKYYFSLSALFSIALAAIYTFTTLYESNIATQSSVFLVPTHTISDISHVGLSSAEGSLSSYDSLINFLDINSTPIVFIWLLGLMVFLVRMLYGLYFIKQIRFSAEKLKDNKWQHLVDKFLINVGSNKTVEVAQSALVKVPMMIGYLKPIILFPVGVVNAMDSKEVEAIIAHELSHVIRNDYIINLIQSFVEVLFYYHPAVWWLSSIVRAERENSCDDMAISMTKSNLTYAKALLHIGQHGGNANSLVMTFGGKKKKLLLRVQRILNQSQYKPRVMEKIITSTLLFVLIVGISLGANTNDIPMHNSIETGSIPSDRVESPLVTTFAERPKKEHHFIEVDTLPNNDNASCQMMYYNNDVRVDIWKEDGKIVKLWVDGKRIDEADYGKYQAYIDDAPIAPNAPPTPPTPPTPPSPSVAPSAPAPPSPPIIPKRKKGSKSYELKSEGNVIMWQDDADNIDVIIDEDYEDDVIKWLKNDDGKWVLDDQVEILRIKKDAIDEELKALSEITFIDSLHPTLKLSEFNDGSRTIKIKRNGSVNGKELELLIEQQMHELAKEQAKLAKLSDESRRVIIELEKGTIDLQKELEKNKLSIEGDLFDISISEIEDDILAIQLDNTANDFDYQLFLNGENSDWLARNDFGSSKQALLNSKFEEEMVKDGLIKNLNKYNFKLSNKTFRVNGSKINAKLTQKYLNMLWEIMGITPNSQIKYNRTVKPGKSTTTMES